MRRAALVLAVLAAVVAAAQPIAARTRGVLAVVDTGSKARLGYVDPATLRFVGKSTQVGYYTWPAVRSPDGTRLALARSDRSDGVRIVDVRHMRTLTAFKVTAGSPNALAWVGARKLLVVADGWTVVAVDPVSGRQLWQRSLPAVFDDVAATADGFAFLSSPPDDYQNAVGPATLTTVNSKGVVRSVQLDSIITGSREPDASNPQGAQRIAGLAVDAAGNRAYVIGAGEPVAEVDLGTLAVTYHGSARTLSKLLDGPDRTATWLPNGTIAVTGYDGHVGVQSGESETPAGLTIVDPRDWSSRVIDPTTTSVRVSGNTLVAYSWFASSGFSVYGPDGSLHLHALDGMSVQDLQIGGGAAFATTSNGSTGYQFAVVDLASARVLSMRPLSRANVLLVP